MAASGRAKQDKKQLILRFTPEELTKMGYLKEKLNLKSNNELFIHLMYDYDNVKEKAKFEEKEKNRFKDALTELKFNSKQFLTSFEAFKKSSFKKIKGIELDRYSDY